MCNLSQTFIFQLKCANCGDETHEFVYLTLLVSVCAGVIWYIGNNGTSHH